MFKIVLVIQDVAERWFQMGSCNGEQQVRLPLQFG